MRCYKIRKLILPYIENALSAADVQRVRSHLDACDSCMREFKSIKSVASALRSNSSHTIRPNQYLWPKIKASLEANQKEMANQRVRKPVWATASAAIGLVLISLASLSLMLPYFKTTDSQKQDAIARRPSSSVSRDFSKTNENVSKTFRPLEVKNNTQSPSIDVGKPIGAPTKPKSIDASTGKSLSQSLAKPAYESKAEQAPAKREIDESKSLKERKNQVADSEANTNVAYADIEDFDENFKEDKDDLPVPPAVAIGRIEHPKSTFRAVQTIDLNLSEAKEDMTSVDIINKNDRHEKRKALFSYP